MKDISSGGGRKDDINKSSAPVKCLTNYHAYGLAIICIILLLLYRVNNGLQNKNVPGEIHGAVRMNHSLGTYI